MVAVLETEDQGQRDAFTDEKEEETEEGIGGRRGLVEGFEVLHDSILHRVEYYSIQVRYLESAEYNQQLHTCL